MARFVPVGLLTRRTLLAGLALPVAGCVVEPANPYPPVPARRAEVIPPAPRGAVVWQPGHYQWDGAAYVWVPGRYVARRAGRWERGHWQRAGGRWVWVPAQWR